MAPGEADGGLPEAPCGPQRERERGRGRERQRDRDRQRDRETEREREREVVPSDKISKGRPVCPEGAARAGSGPS